MDWLFTTWLPSSGHQAAEHRVFQAWTDDALTPSENQAGLILGLPIKGL